MLEQTFPGGRAWPVRVLHPSPAAFRPPRKVSPDAPASGDISFWTPLIVKTPGARFQEMLRNLRLHFPHAVLAAGAILLTVVSQIYFWPNITDDAFFTFRSARNLLDGLGPVFNAPSRVEVFSNPLWMYLLATASWISGLGIILLSKLLGLLFTIGTIFAILRFCRLSALEDRWSVATLTLVWLALTPGFQAYATIGLEVPLLTFLLTLGITQSAISLQQNAINGQWLAATCFGLAGVTRPEGPLYAALWGGILTLHWLKNAAHKKYILIKLCQIGILTALPALSYETFRLFYYKKWLSNTAIAKPPNVFGYSFFETDVSRWLVPLGASLLLCYAVRTILAQNRTAFFPYVLASGGPIAAGLIFYFYAGSDWMLFSRFLLPVLPALFLLLAVMIDEPRRSLSGWTVRTILFLGLVGANSFWITLPYLKNEGLASMLMRGGDVVTVGKWIAGTFHKPIRIVGRRTGAVSYYASQHTVSDLFGLTEYEQALYLRQSGTIKALALESGNPLLRGPPELLMITRPPDQPGSPRYTTDELAFLNGHYACVKSFPQGHWGTYDMWLRVDIAQDQLEIDCTASSGAHHD